MKGRVACPACRVYQHCMPSKYGHTYHMNQRLSNKQSWIGTEYRPTSLTGHETILSASDVHSKKTSHLAVAFERGLTDTLPPLVTAQTLAART